MADQSDALDTTNPVGDGAPAAKADPTAAIQSLLDMAPEDAARRVVKDWLDSYPPVKTIREQWRVNRAHAMGFTGVRMVKAQDEQRAFIPLGAVPNLAAMNIAQRLRRRLKSFLFADRPELEAIPSRDTDDAGDRAETATRVLRFLSGEGQLSYALAAMRAFDMASDYGSGFLHLFVDPQGGGWRPRRVQCRPDATTEADALLDPATGAPYRGPLVTKFARTDGALTDDPADPDVDRAWMPALRCDTLNGKHVRFLPWYSADVWAADGLMVAALVPLRDLRATVPDEIAALTPDELAKLVEYRPEYATDLLPRNRRDPMAGGVDEDSLVFTVTRYHRQSALYPQGARLLVAGESTLLDRGPWWDAEHNEPLDIPVTQMKQLEEEDNGYGAGIMQGLGPGNEIMAFLFGVALEHLDRFTRRKTFLPLVSNLQAEQLQAETATVLPISPGGQPIYEDLPDLPNVVKEMLVSIRDDMKDESMLQDAGTALNPPGVESGAHALAILEQVVQGLGDIRQNTARGFVRGGRIMLQLVRAFFDVPQRLSWQGDDGGFREQEFVGTDLGDTRDVRLAAGTFMQLSPTAKAALVQGYAQAGFISGEDARHIVETNLGGVVGLQDNPHLLRVRRQIAAWRDGPPELAAPAAPALVPPVAAAPAPALAAPPAGMPAPGAPPAPPPSPFAAALARIFDTLPVDLEPSVAKLRAYELGRAQASTRYARFPQPWRAGLDAAYEAARQAAGIQTVAEQAQAAQAQAQAASAPKVTLTGKLGPAETADEAQRAGVSPQAAQQDTGTAQQAQALEADQHQLEREKASTERAVAGAKTQIEAMKLGHEAARGAAPTPPAAPAAPVPPQVP